MTAPRSGLERKHNGGYCKRLTNVVLFIFLFGIMITTRRRLDRVLKGKYLFLLCVHCQTCINPSFDRTLSTGNVRILYSIVLD